MPCSYGLFDQLSTFVGVSRPTATGPAKQYAPENGGVEWRGRSRASVTQIVTQTKEARLANPKPQSQEPRQCKGPCERTLAWEDFPVDGRDETGSVIRRKTMCADCLRERQKAYRRQQAAGRKRTNGIARVPAAWEWLRLKRCSKCEGVKPWAHFSPVMYWPDGEVRRVQAHCKECRNKANRGYSRPATPERLAYIAEWKRNQTAMKRRERIGRGRHYPKEPFIAWLKLVEQEEGGLARLAEDAGLHPDTLAKVMIRNKVIAEKTAEAALCARGLMLADIYGHDLDEAIAA